MNFPATLTLLQTHSLPSLVQEEIERMILEGNLAPGEPLREASLAAMLGVSRGPIREAFRALEEKGLISVVKNCGVHVRTLSLDEADQIYEVRIALEALIGRLVIGSITVEGVAELEKIIAAMEAAVERVDIDNYTRLNLSLHDRLAALTGNVRLHSAYGTLVGELSLFRRQAYLHDRETLTISLREHVAIVRAVAARDTDLAVVLLRRHAEESRQRMHQVLYMHSRSTNANSARNRREPGKG